MNDRDDVMNGEEALRWMRRRPGASGRILFRGQSKVWPDIRPTITRKDIDEATRQALWAICRRFVHVAQMGLTGYAIDRAHDRLAILQHYIMRSPLVDLTGTPAIALHFAALGARAGTRCVIYAVDADKVEARRKDVEITDHGFLAIPTNAGGAAHRWLRQDGFTIGPKAWMARSDVEDFDLLKLPGVAECHFTLAERDRELIRHLGDLESIEGDPLARSVHGLVRMAARDLGCMTPELDALLAKTRTMNPCAELLHEIDALAGVAGSLGDMRACAEIERLHVAATSNYWDTSWECALNHWTRRVNTLAQQARDFPEE